LILQEKSLLEDPRGRRGKKRPGKSFLHARPFGFLEWQDKVIFASIVGFGEKR
jgi:hypothetical protein